LIKEKNISIYDLGDISRYLLSIFTPKSEETPFYGFAEIYKFIYEKVPNSKIFVIGGSDELASTMYTPENLFSNIIHLDSGIDVKSQFKYQLKDIDKNKWTRTYNQ
jgi:hypothetical protein